MAPCQSLVAATCPQKVSCRTQRRNDTSRPCPKVIARGRRTHGRSRTPGPALGLLFCGCDGRVDPAGFRHAGGGVGERRRQRDLSADRRFRLLRGVLAGQAPHGRSAFGADRSARPSLQQGLRRRPDHPQEPDRFDVTLRDDRADGARRTHRRADVRAARRRRRPAVARGDHQAGLRRRPLHRRLLGRPVLHEDEWFGHPWRHALRCAGDALCERRLARGVRRLSGAVRTGLRGRRAPARVHRLRERGQPGCGRLHEHDHEPAPDGRLRTGARRRVGQVRPSHARPMLRHRGLELCGALRPRPRGLPTCGPDGQGLLQPRLHQGTRVAASRMVRARLGDGMVDVGPLGPGLGRRDTRLGLLLGGEPLRRAGRREPRRLLLLVGHQPDRRRQPEPGPGRRHDRDAVRSACGPSRTTAVSCGRARSASAPAPATTISISRRSGTRTEPSPWSPSTRTRIRCR